MFSIEPVQRVTTEVTGFTVTFTPEQLRYVSAVLGATVRNGSIPGYAAGMYEAFSSQLEDAGLVNRQWDHPDEQRTDERGVPYANTLFDHLGLRMVNR